MRLSFISVLALTSALFGFASASPALETRQEAVRFGVVSVTPSKVKLGEKFTVKYNSTLARWQPKYLDVYLQGVYPSNFATPYYQLLRVDYGNHTHSWTFHTKLPGLDNDTTDGYIVNASYSVWAFITYPTGTGAFAVGGVAAPIGVELS